jgi:hypothetical protein
MGCSWKKSTPETACVKRNRALVGCSPEPIAVDNVGARLLVRSARMEPGRRHPRAVRAETKEVPLPQGCAKAQQTGWAVRPAGSLCWPS